MMKKLLSLLPLVCLNVSIVNAEKITLKPFKRFVFDKKVSWDLSKSTHLSFILTGDGSATPFRVTLSDANGRKRSYGEGGDHKDFQLLSRSPIRYVIDLTSEKPEVDSSNSIDLSKVRKISFSGTARTKREIEITDIKYDSLPSINNAWEKRREHSKMPAVITKADLKADWLWGEEKEKSPYMFRLRFSASKKVSSAIFKGTADNNFILKVNGSVHSTNHKWSHLNTADITSMLVSGTNEIICIVSKGSVGGLVGELTINYTDGTTDYFPTGDKHWELSDSGDTWRKPVVLGEYGIGPWGQVLDNSIIKTYEFEAQSNNIYRMLAELKSKKSSALSSTNGNVIKVNKDGWTFSEKNTKKRFIPIGVNYLGLNLWHPSFFEMFVPKEIDEDFAILSANGVNTLRIVFTHWLKTDKNNPDKLDQRDLDKFRLLVELARKHNLRIIPTGCGPKLTSNIILDKKDWEIHKKHWKQFVAPYINDPVIFSWNLQNEPHVAWNHPTLLPAFRKFLKKKYGSFSKLKLSWGETAKDISSFDDIQIPPNKAKSNDPRLYDFQLFRERIATKYVRDISEAIRSVDPTHLITCGMIQYSFPGVRNTKKASGYVAFNPAAIVKYLDYLSPHFYPIYRMKVFNSSEDFAANMFYMQAWLRYCNLGKPVILEEFGWYGGYELLGNGYLNQNDQRRFCTSLIEGNMEYISGFINWAYQDCPNAVEVSGGSGMFDNDKNIKEWGRDMKWISKNALKLFKPQVKCEDVIEYDPVELITAPGTGWHYDSMLKTYIKARSETGNHYSFKPKKPSKPMKSSKQLKPLERIGIRASRNGAQFILKTSKKPFFVKGFNYIRLRKDHATFDADTKTTKAHYDPKQAEAMFSALSKAGYNTVRVFVIGRSKINPGIAGDYKTTKAIYEPYVDNFIDFLRRATRHNIRVFPTFGDGGLPNNAYYRSKPIRGKGHNKNALVLTKEGIDARVDYISSFLSYIKDKEPSLLPTLLGLQCQNEAYICADKWPFTIKEGKFKAPNGKTYDMSKTDERQALMDDGYRYYHKRIAAAVKAIDKNMLVAEGVFVPRAVGKDPKRDAGVWPGKIKDERYPPTLTALGNGASGFS